MHKEHAAHLHAKMAFRSPALTKGTPAGDYEAVSPLMIQRALAAPSAQTLTPPVVRALQHQLGNQAVQRLLSVSHKAEPSLQRCGCGGAASSAPEQEQLIQAKRVEHGLLRKVAPQGIQRTKGDPCYIPEQDSLYADVAVDSPTVTGPGEEFTAGQKTAIYNRNNEFAEANPPDAFPDFSLQESDANMGGRVIREDEATPVHSAMDHIVPVTAGGCNSSRNAQVLSQTENGSKSGVYPWGGDDYTGLRVYDPEGDNVYDLETAEDLGLMVMQGDVRQRKGAKKKK